jgi:hypothetical protein
MLEQDAEDVGVPPRQLLLFLVRRPVGVRPGVNTQMPPGPVAQG